MCLIINIQLCFCSRVFDRELDRQQQQQRPCLLKLESQDVQWPLLELFKHAVDQNWHGHVSKRSRWEYIGIGEKVNSREKRNARV